MTEVRKKVTFDTALPRGTCATFTHEGQRWIAYPQDKNQALGVAIDRMLGVLDRVRDDLLVLINTHPEVAAQVATIVVRTNRAKQLAQEKAQAWTM